MIWKVFLDGELLGSNATQQTPEKHLIDASLSLEINKTGSFECKIEPTHDLYSKIFKMKSLIEILFDSEIMFRGRVLDTDDNLSGELGVNCEGCLAYLLDSYIEPYDELERTPRQQLEWLISQHNAQVETYKHFSVGNINIAKANSVEKFSSSSDQKIQDALLSDLIGRFGGFIKVRYTSTTNYIDWYALDSGDLCSQPLRFGMNMIDLTRRESADDIFSILKPIGDDDLTIESVNNGSKYIINEDMRSKFGTIYRVEHFTGITDANTLLTRARTFVEQNSTGLTENLTVTALDLIVLDSSVEAIRNGKRVEIVAMPVNLSKVYTCAATNYDLINIERSQYTLGTIRQSLTDYQANTSKKADKAKNDASSNKAKIQKINEVIKQMAGDLIVVAENIKITADRLDADIGDLKIRSGNLEGRMSGAEASIEMHEGEIKLRAKQVDVDRIDEVLYGSGEGQEGLIGKSSELFTRMNVVEIDLNGAEGTIGLKGLTSELYGDTRKMKEDFDTLSQHVDQQGERVTKAEVKIDSLEGEIDLRVKSTEFNDELERIDNAITVNRQNINLKVSVNDVINQINISKEGVVIDANRVDLKGLVTASELQAEIADIKKLIANLSVSGNAVVTGTLNVKGGTVLSGNTQITNLDATVFKVGGQQATWRSKDVVTSVGFERHTTSTPILQTVAGGQFTGTYLNSDTKVNTRTETIYYLGSSSSND